jgi:hypothetical protein
MCLSGLRDGIRGSLLGMVPAVRDTLIELARSAMTRNRTIMVKMHANHRSYSHYHHSEYPLGFLYLPISLCS